MMKFRPIYLLLLVVLLLHLPFLGADPDKSVDLHTRGAWTDEGLYAAQARNFVNYGDFGLEENTTFIRGPLYDLFRVPFFFMFGTHLQLARIITLLGVLLCLFLLTRAPDTNGIVPFLVILVMLQFRIFHFSHYAMAEMLSVAMVFISYYFLSKFFTSGRNLHLLTSCAMMFVAWGFKIQYLYLTVLIPAVVIFYGISQMYFGKLTRKKISVGIFRSIAYSLLFPLIYFLVWYLPNRNFYNMVMFEQTSQRFDVWEKLSRTINFNFTGIALDPANLSLAIGFVIAVTFLILSAIHREIRFKNLLVIIFSGSWLLIEFHKLGMTYLPQRYLLSFYAATGFFAAAVLYQVFDQSRKLKYLISVFLLGSIVFSSVFYIDSLENRSWELQRVNRYLKTYSWDDQTVAGVWAPSVTWGTKARVIPVWSGYHDPNSFFINYSPRMIVEEPDEGTSENFFKSNGMDLAGMSDSVRYFDVWRYGMELFWITDPGELHENDDQ